MSSITVLPAQPEEKKLVTNLLQLYLHDFSEMEALETNEEGLFTWDGFDNFWTQPNHHIFLVRCENRVVGFAFIKRGAHHEKTNQYDEQLTDMVEFFVLRRYRRQAVGHAMALHCFSAFPGRWQVRVVANNPGAIQFWQKAVAGFSKNKFEVFHLETPPEVVYYFESP